MLASRSPVSRKRVEEAFGRIKTVGVLPLRQRSDVRNLAH